MSNQNNVSVSAKSFSAEQESLGHFNNMNGISYDINNPLLKLRVIASSCFFNEPAYYSEESHSGRVNKKVAVPPKHNLIQHLKGVLNSSQGYFIFQDEGEHTVQNLLVKQIDLALDYNARATLEEAVRLRNEDNIRTTPQVIMVRAAHHDSVRGTSLIREFAPKIMRRADEPAVQLAYQLSAFGRAKIPNALKKAWKAMLEKQSEYNLAKYRLENKVVKTVDVVNLVHAKGTEIDMLMKGNLKLSTEDTWEALISKEGSNKQNWTQAVDLMGHMALLRNLRNLIKNDVNMSPVWEKLVAGAEAGKQLPFRYYSAAKAVMEVRPLKVEEKNSLSDALNLSMGQMPKFKGRVMSLCDNSGSAQGVMTSEFGSVKVSEIANLSAILTAKNADDGYVGVFGDTLAVHKVQPQANVFNEMATVEKYARGIGQGTENGVWLFFDNAIKQKEHWDHIFVYSDMQAGHGGLYGTNPRDYKEFGWIDSSRHIDVAKLINVYREKVNPNVHVYLVQVAGYGDSLVPEFYDKTYILGGWSAGLFKFAHRMQEINELLANPQQLNTALEQAKKIDYTPKAKKAEHPKDDSSLRPKNRMKM